ncbi:hypothetical protein [Psychromonas sp. MME2]|uniref:hypothetical protein n=1 Tax=unclassified Psychromonas TaxID=2614957 RepID=UPI00339C16E3
MLRARLGQLLLLLWKLSSVFIIPIIILLYVYVMNTYFGPFSFEQLDQGQNKHKWLVFAIYLIYLLFWKISNKKIINYLQRFEYS